MGSPSLQEAIVERANLAYYERNAAMYAEQTSRADLSHLYAPFLALLPPAARILDVGCGGGRDLKAFRQRGFDPVGIDPSPALVEIARRYSGAEALVGKVEDLQLSDAFDGVWACASLLHLPRRVFPEALRRIHSALVGGGVLFLSVQSGAGDLVGEDGRFFARYDSSALRLALKDANFQLLRIWDSEDSLPGRAALTWLNLLAKKPAGDS